jgi:hypothetical protein
VVSDPRRRRCARCGKSCYREVCAECHFTPELQDDLLDLKQRFPRVSVERLARDLGVNVRLVHASLAYAMRRRGMRVPSISQ